MEEMQELAQGCIYGIPVPPGQRITGLKGVYS